MSTTPEQANLPPYRLPVTAVVARLKTDLKTGLSAAEAAARLEQYGKNELPSEPPVPWYIQFLGQFRDPLTFLLLIAVGISFVVWIIEHESAIPYESLVILAIVIFNGILGYLQESRAEHAVEALRAMSAPTARVLRDGAPHTIPAADVVPGDVLLIEEGDTLPADGRVVEAIAMRVSEAMLTGESVPVSKDSLHFDQNVGIADQANMIFSGTAVSSGRGRAVITSTGEETELGKIAGTLQSTEETATPLQRELDRVGKLLGLAVIAIAVIIALTIILLGGVQSVADLVQVLLLAISLAVAAVPEGLKAITTITLSLGMQRMARRNVIVRKLSAVETLGSTTVVCSDKTGTLTKNEMTVRALVTANGRIDFTGTGYSPDGEARQDGKPISKDLDDALCFEARRAFGAASLANNANLVQRDGRWTVQGDPTEGALLVAARKVGLTEEELDARFPRVGEVPFSSERKMMSTVHLDQEADQEPLVVSKGAPDIVLARCTHERVGRSIRPLTPERRDEIETTIEQLASEALRTLGVADRRLKGENGNGKDHQWTEEIEEQFIFLGVIGMIDPPRSEAKDAVRVARGAGVRPVMITGDHPKTAEAIARELDICRPGERTMTGAELQNTDDAALQKLVMDVPVYARVAPEHKLRIVKALQANHQIAAMTGDGVNDAPALKAADIGVAMGITGTDVSKGAADMILTDDNFASIVAAVEEGRSIFKSIRDSLRYLLSSNMGEVLTMFLGVIFARFLNLAAEEGSHVVVPILATQILWINLVTDSGPALALGMEPPDPDVMKRPPRDPRIPVINGRMWFDIFFAGFILAAGTLFVMDLTLPGGLIEGTGDIVYARTMAFTTLVSYQLFNVFNARAEGRSAFSHLFTNRWIWIAVLLSAFLQVLVIYVPFLQTAFNTVSLSFGDWLVCLGVGSTILWFTELRKLIFKA
ncbi:MAG: cation-translocating P-type ATPase [Anaerolineae bacterium]|nr:cation-translocating P-type ATPase [Anaerolineae bacterium]